MAGYRWQLLIHTVFGALVDIFVSILTKPIMLLPLPLGYPTGLISKFTSFSPHYQVVFLFASFSSLSLACYIHWDHSFISGNSSSTFFLSLCCCYWQESILQKTHITLSGWLCFRQLACLFFSCYLRKSAKATQYSISGELRELSIGLSELNFDIISKYLVCFRATPV